MSVAIKPKKRRNVGAVYEQNHKPVATWVRHKDYDLLVKLAQIHGVKVSVYLRAIICDALDDERLSSINLKEGSESSPQNS